jgi:hypothetical protein
MNKQAFTAALFVSALTTILPSLSMAEELSFTFTTEAAFGTTGSLVAQWDQQSNPSAGVLVNLGIIVDVTGFTGSGSNLGTYYMLDSQGNLVIGHFSQVIFYYGGGFEVDPRFSWRSPPLLFAGPDTTPVFSPSLYRYAASVNNLAATLTVKAVGGVPEPSTWAMMALGFVGLGFVARRGRKLALAAV